MFCCPFAKFHFVSLSNVPKIVREKVIVGLRPVFYDDVALPWAKPFAICSKINDDGIGSLKEMQHLLCHLSLM